MGMLFLLLFLDFNSRRLNNRNLRFQKINHSMFALPKNIISFLLPLNILGCSNSPQIIKYFGIPNLPKLVIKYAISLVLIRIIRITFKPIDGPINPIYVSLLQILDQIFPGPIPFVVSKLSQNVRNSITTYKCLGIEHFLPE